MAELSRRRPHPYPRPAAADPEVAGPAPVDVPGQLASRRSRHRLAAAGAALLVVGSAIAVQALPSAAWAALHVLAPAAGIVAMLAGLRRRGRGSDRIAWLLLIAGHLAIACAAVAPAGLGRYAGLPLLVAGLAVLGARGISGPVPLALGRRGLPRSAAAIRRPFAARGGGYPLALDVALLVGVPAALVWTLTGPLDAAVVAAGAWVVFSGRVRTGTATMLAGSALALALTDLGAFRALHHVPEMLPQLATVLAGAAALEPDGPCRSGRRQFAYPAVALAVAMGPAPLAAAAGVLLALRLIASKTAGRDALTGLGDRAALTGRLDAARDGETLLLLDLDGFTELNDTLGHPAGDELLVDVARRLRSALPDAALLARPGGDEFAAVLTGEAAAETAVRALACLAPAFGVAGCEVHVTAGAGLLGLSGRGGWAEALRDADLALYAAKAAGRNQVVRFSSDLRAARDSRSAMVAGLRRALAHDEFRLHYQPVVRLHDGRVTAVEALLRWSPPDGAPVPPATFIPLAEETGLIVPIGWWVLRQACAEAAHWHAEHGLSVTVNVSGHQLSESAFVDTVLAVLDQSGLPATALVLELTETTLIADPSMTTRLDRLRAHGIRVAIDDFGTGYSSLSYLVQLPVDILKIDRAFTGPVGLPAPQRWAFTRAILELAGSLQLDTIAEGVETAEQARVLRELNCPYVQGYLYSPPVPPERIEELLSSALAGSAL